MLTLQDNRRTLNVMELDMRTSNPTLSASLAY